MHIFRAKWLGIVEKWLQKTQSYILGQNSRCCRCRSSLFFFRLWMRNRTQWTTTFKKERSAHWTKLIKFSVWDPLKLKLTKVYVRPLVVIWNPLFVTLVGLTAFTWRNQVNTKFRLAEIRDYSHSTWAPTDHLQNKSQFTKIAFSEKTRKNTIQKRFLAY